MVYYILEYCKDKQHDLVITEIEKLQGIKFTIGLYYKIYIILQETYKNAISLSPENQEKYLYNKIIRETIVSIIIISPDLVFEKIFV
jgi:hypothetical protein